MVISSYENKKTVSWERNKKTILNLNFKLMRKTEICDNIRELKEIGENRILILYD